MDVVAGIASLFAMWRNKYARPGLIRSFVVAEANIAVDAVCAVSNGKVCNRGVKGGDALYQLRRKLLQPLIYGFILLLMGSKPLSIVILAQLSEKLYNLYHAKRGYFSIIALTSARTAAIFASFSGSESTRSIRATITSI